MLTPLDELVEQVARGTLRIKVGQVFKLDDIVEAHAAWRRTKPAARPSS